jgi:hypothetical protein
MAWIKAALLTGFLSILMMDSVPEGTAAERDRDRGSGRPGNCRRGERLNIQDLDMSPDPVVDGQRVRTWKVRINFDGQRECDTQIIVREGNNVVGHARDFKMRPGENAVEIPAADNFRFRGRETCFNVQVDLEGSRQQVDADRRFCARQRTTWSMSEATK